LVLSFGGPILPAAVLLGISMVSTVAALSAYFFKEKIIDFEKVEFFKFRTPEIQIAGQAAY
jgi:hypothetical protein